jgi:hypothetical protein
MGIVVRIWQEVETVRFMIVVVEAREHSNAGRLVKRQVFNAGVAPWAPMVR